jgi:hypothetical protein
MLSGVRRILVTLLSVVALLAGLTVAATPAAAVGGCTINGGVGVDPYAPVYMETFELFSLIGYADMPGCTTGLLDIEAVPVGGTPATCTIVLPKTPGSPGAGCTSLLALGGLSLYEIKIVAEAVAVSTSGGRSTATTVCTVFLRPGSSFPGPRCSISGA